MPTSPSMIAEKGALAEHRNARPACTHGLLAGINHAFPIFDAFSVDAKNSGSGELKTWRGMNANVNSNE